MKTFLLLFLTFAVAVCPRVEAQTYDTNNVVVQTFAGSGFSGYLDGIGQQTMFNYPKSLVVDSQNNIFVWDGGNYRIRKISPDLTVSTFAGGGTQPTGVGTNVNFNGGGYGIPWGMAIDHNNTIWMSTTAGALYKITSAATVTATNLSLSWAWGICADSGNNLYISDYTGNKIYRYKTNNILEVFAGSGNSGSADGNGIFTSFNYPAALAADAADNIYVFDSGASLLIRKINQNRDVVTIAGHYAGGSDSDGIGTNAAFSSINQMCFDNSGNLILACGAAGSFSSIRKMTAATNVTTMAGSFTQNGYTNGPGNLARFNGANGVCVSGGTIYVADSNNQRIRNVTFNPAPQVVSGANLDLSTYAGLKITGVVGRTYQVQSSPDMTNWTTRTTLLLNSSPYLWIDQNPVSGNKFYRALLLP